MAKSKKEKLQPDGVLAGLISQLNDLEGWEFREVIRSSMKLRKATRAVAKAEERRARLAKIAKERKKATKGLNYERA